MIDQLMQANRPVRSVRWWQARQHQHHLHQFLVRWILVERINWLILSRHIPQWRTACCPSLRKDQVSLLEYPDDLYNDLLKRAPVGPVQMMTQTDPIIHHLASNTQASTSRNYEAYRHVQAGGRLGSNRRRIHALSGGSSKPDIRGCVEWMSNSTWRRSTLVSC